MRLKNKDILWPVGAFLFYSLTFLAITFPLIQHFGSQYIGIPQSGDSSTYVWSIWHFRYSVMHGSSPFETEMLFHPMGSSIIMHGYIPTVGLINLFLDNAVLTLNIVLLLSFAFSGLGVYSLLRHFNIRHFLCFAAGFIYAFFPYKTAHLLEHFNLQLTALIPYFILFFLKAFSYRDGTFFPFIQSRKYFIFLVILSIVSVFTDYYYSIYVFYFALLYSLFNKLHPYFKVIQKWKLITITLVVFICGHFIIRGFVLLEVDDKGALWWSPDLASLVVPGPNNLLYGGLDWVKNYPSKYFRYPESVEFVMFLGIGFIALVILFFSKIKFLNAEKEIRFMGMASFVFLMFSFPVIQFLGNRLFYNVFGLVYFIPFMNNVRGATRYQLMFMMLFLPILMKLLDLLWEKKGYKKLITVLILLVFIEYIPRHYTFITYNDVPSVYKELKKMPDGAVLPVPFGFRDGIKHIGKFNTNDLLYQTTHQKPIIGGYISRLSRENLEQFSDNPTAMDLYLLMDHQPVKTPQPGSFNLPVKYIVVEPTRDPAFENYLDSALGKKLYQKSKIEDYLLYQLK